MKGTLVIVPCGQGKIWDKKPYLGSVQACDVYTGAPFKVNRDYAERFGDSWVILSAKYGFILPDFKISESYNVTFKKKSTNSVSLQVLVEQIKNLRLDTFDIVIGLGGKEYREMIEQAFKDFSIRVDFPFAGLPLGVGMKAIRKAIESQSLRS